MKIGLLACDHIQSNYSDYPELFAKLLPQFDFDVFNVCEGVFPSSASDYEAWIITGSKYSVYDDIDWIKRLKCFVQDISLADKYCIGICFGHQMLGEAMGGKVMKAQQGWCVGIHEFDVVDRENWMNPYQPKVNLLMSCQDQITVLPPNSKVLLKTSLCPVGSIKIGEKMLGIQGHPEFSTDYIKFLMEDRINRIPENTLKVGINSLSKPVSNTEVAQWIAEFISK